MANCLQHTAGATSCCLVEIVAVRGERRVKLSMQNSAAISSNLVLHYLTCQV